MVVSIAFQIMAVLLYNYLQYFETLRSIQNVSLPFHPEEILRSFRDGSLVKTLTDFDFPGAISIEAINMSTAVC